MTNNIFRQKIVEALSRLKAGYEQKDVNKLEEFMSCLFESSEKTAVLGTSDGEWMHGVEGAWELFESDWKYWGNVDIDTAQAEICIVGEAAFVNLSATVRYEFEYTEQKLESYLNFVKGFLDPSQEQYKMSAKAKAGAMGFVLTHFNQNRPDGKREYFYPLRIDAVMTLHEDRAIFKFIKFSMDYQRRYPELRIDNQMMNLTDYYKQQSLLKEEYAIEQRGEVKAVIAQLKKLVEEGFNGSGSREEICSLFCTKESTYIIDTAGKHHYGQETGALIEAQRDIWQKLAVDYEAVYADVKGDAAWLVCSGIASKTTSPDDGAKTLMSDIKNTVESSMNAKDKLFVVQREIADYFLQQAKGEYYLWPARIAAMMIKEENQWKIRSVTLSYPFYYVLEGKYTGFGML